MNFTKAKRAEMIKDFALRHGGEYNAAAFVDEVEESGEEHPAYEWFEWDDSSAARAHRVWQARMFASGIRVKYEVKTIGENRAMKIKVVESPIVLSPREGRSNGGGYVLMNVEKKSHTAELCQQAAADLKSWRYRYSAALDLAEIKPETIEAIITQLEKTAETPKPKAKSKRAGGQYAAAMV